MRAIFTKDKKKCLTEGAEFEVGDKVFLFPHTSKRGVIKQVYPNGECLVKWDSGGESSHDSKYLRKL